MEGNINNWNAFMPSNLLQKSSAFLTGCINESECSVYITGTRPTNADCENDPVLGYFTNLKDGAEKKLLTSAARSDQRSRSVWLEVHKKSGNSVTCCLYRPETAQSSMCVPVLFEPQDILSSFVLNDKGDGLAEDSHTQIRKLSRVYAKNDTSAQGKNQNYNSMQRFGNVFVCLLSILTALFNIGERLLGLISLRLLWFRVCVQTPAVINNISFKLRRFKHVRLKLDQHQGSKLILYDVCGQQLLDSMLGVAFMLCVMHNGTADSVANAVMHWADDTAKNLNDLLHWLMGAPAGLKLNAQLTEYMGHFFLYHVYLWAGYLSVLRPLLSWVIWISACFGTLGLSIQLCLVQDIISMLTLHIYCFYVYAARLYSLQIYALASLWRLFRGKKWNVLRLRVDSALYTIDQLCVGTLLFTVLLFLLPTSLLYYSVFVTLRLLMLSLHGLLTLVIDRINTIPAVTVSLRAFRSKCVAGDLVFTVLQNKEDLETDKSVFLHMEMTQLPMQKLYLFAQAHMKTECHQREKQYSWVELMQKLFSGSLIYPWVNPYDLNSKEKSH